VYLFTCFISFGGVVAFSSCMKQSGLKKVFSKTNGTIDLALRMMAAPVLCRYHTCVHKEKHMDTKHSERALCEILYIAKTGVQNTTMAGF